MEHQNTRITRLEKSDPAPLARTARRSTAKLTEEEILAETIAQHFPQAAPKRRRRKAPVERSAGDEARAAEDVAEVPDEAESTPELAFEPSREAHPVQVDELSWFVEGPTGPRAATAAEEHAEEEEAVPIDWFQEGNAAELEEAVAEQVEEDAIYADFLADNLLEEPVEELLEGDLEDFRAAFEVESGPVDHGEERDGRVDSILACLEELRVLGREFAELRDAVLEVRGRNEASQAKRDILAGMLSTLSEDVKELRLEVAATNRAALASAKTVQTLSSTPQGRVHESPRPTPARRGPHWTTRPPALVMGVGLLLLGWSLMLYVKSGSVLLALLCLVIVNTAGGAMIFLGRSDAKGRPADSPMRWLTAR